MLPSRERCNAALEDAAIFDNLLDEFANWATVIAQFTVRRKADAHALREISEVIST
jgi:kynurenine 3-monooxygenase